MKTNFCTNCGYAYDPSDKSEDHAGHDIIRAEDNEPSKAEKKITPPTLIKGTSVSVVEGSKTTFRNEEWVTLVPDDENDDRLWEFSLTTGKLIQTK